MDNFGDHSSFCRLSPYRIKRHDDVRDCSRDQARASGAIVKQETRGLIHDTADRPADNRIWLPSSLNLPSDGPVWVDYSVPSPFAAHCIDQAAVSYGSTLIKSENEKIQGAMEAAQHADASFCPFIVSSTGGFGDKAINLVQTIAEARALRWGIPKTSVIDLIVDQIAVSVQRNNARMWQSAHTPPASRLAFRGISNVAHA